MSDRPALRGGDERRPGGSEDHLERARKRVAEIRALHGDDIDIGEAFIDKWYAEAPAGWTYEWKTHSVFNKEFPQYMNALYHTGWEPVPAARHRNLLFPGYTGDSIIIEGMILMERPSELTQRIRAAELRRATGMVRTSEEKLMDAPPGTPPRGTSGFTRPIIGGHVGPIIPD